MNINIILALIIFLTIELNYYIEALPSHPHPFPGYQKQGSIPVINKTNLDEIENEEIYLEEEESIKDNSFKRKHHKKRLVKIEPTESTVQTATLSPIQISQIAAIVNTVTEKKSPKITEKKFDTGAEVKDVKELWACTTESLDKGTCHLVHSFKLSTSPIICNENRLKVIVDIGGEEQELFLTQSNRMLASTQEHSSNCDQRLKMYPLNPGYFAIVLDNNMELVSFSNIDSHIYWLLIKGFEVLNFLLVLFGILDLQRNQISALKAFTIFSAFGSWMFCVFHLKSLVPEFWGYALEHRESKIKEKKEKEEKEEKEKKKK